MKWQYRTIVFEFAKDGLLGDKYINDEEMEATLNEQGNQGWNLVNVVMIQEGLLAVLKRPEGEVKTEPESEPVPAGIRALHINDREPEDVPVTVDQIQKQEQEHIKNLEQNRRKTMQDHEDQIGGIRIS